MQDFQRNKLLKTRETWNDRINAHFVFFKQTQKYKQENAYGRYPFRRAPEISSFALNTPQPHSNIRTTTHRHSSSMPPEGDRRLAGWIRPFFYGIWPYFPTKPPMRTISPRCDWNRRFLKKRLHVPLKKHPVGKERLPRTLKRYWEDRGIFGLY